MLLDPYTDEEHHARAMLMGRVYIPRLGWYIWSQNSDISHPKLLDAITLQPIDKSEQYRRIDAKPYKGRYYD